MTSAGQTTAPRVVDVDTAAMDTSKRPYYFLAAGIFAIFTLGIAAWAFGIGTLTTDQRTMVRILLPITCGFVAGGFVGAISVTNKLIPGVLATATGGFSIWLLMFLLWPEPEHMFSVVVRPHGSGGPLDIACHEGRVFLDFGENRRSEDIAVKGEARFDDIPSTLIGTKLAVSATCNGFKMKTSPVTLELRPGIPIYIPMVPSSGGSAPEIQRPPEIAKDNTNTPRDTSSSGKLVRNFRDNNSHRSAPSPAASEPCDSIKKKIQEKYPDLNPTCQKGEGCQISLRFVASLQPDAEEILGEYQGRCLIVTSSNKTN